MARVVLVHGFTQTAQSWHTIAEALRGDGHDVVAPDLPGHNGTPPADLVTGAARIAEQGGEGVYIGYSMGGRQCLHVALHHPSVVQRLVLLGATAGIDDPVERNRRRHNDELLAARLEAEGVHRFLVEWLAQPLFAGLPHDPADVAARATNTVDGLAGALRLAGTGAQEPLWDRLGDLSLLGIPVLVVAGELDEKFKVVGRRLADAIGATAQLAWVPGAGHAAHLEQPDRFLALVRGFLTGSADDA